MKKYYQESEKTADWMGEHIYKYMYLTKPSVQNTYENSYNKKREIIHFEMGKRFEYTFLQRRYVSGHYMRRCWTSLAIRKIKSKWNDTILYQVWGL